MEDPDCQNHGQEGDIGLCLIRSALSQYEKAMAPILQSAAAVIPIREYKP
jgi:hypothetical protein